MDIRKLQRAIVDGLEDVKAQDILVFNTEHLSPLFERVIVASGTSNRQTKALASSVRESVKAAGLQVLRTEGEDNGEWIIVDCGAAVAHIMQPSIRDYYRLEEIWGGKPVKLKVGSAKTSLVKASEPMDEDDAPAAPARKKPAAKKAAAEVKAAKPAPARKVSSGTTSAAKKAAPVKKAATKTTAAKTAAPKKAAPKKAVTRSTGTTRKAAEAKPVQTVVVGKPAKKTTAKAAPGKKAAPARKAAAPAKAPVKVAAKAPAKKAAAKRG
ncbi:ribosome silencing factor [Ideonella oryzae]|uniref:Ribosomal silencing factor RsfS n=1 Tax=Ideonella oryzae TaxID=2937441 RepID=A0ABT1BKA9_9BURK|nr:ribosome silencing factor [Ideonella oryzae]MCO5976046.1 ribosome silencing factor [Ideonella oryzae]